jgi:hypothetical protein
MAEVTVVLDELCERISGDPDAPGARGTGVAEQEPAVGRFRDIEANEVLCVRV